jgi:hypothetical protein
VKLGILQGRLSKPVGGLYQEFPKYWRNEFDVLPQLGLVGMEWLITPALFEANPFFIDGSNMGELPILSVCADTLVDGRICDKSFLKHNLDPICAQALKSGVEILTIPILDESDLNDDKTRESFCSIIEWYGKSYPEIKFAFEAEMPPNKLNDIVSLCDNFYVTYDTGNITSCGVDHSDFIDFFKDKIVNVHIKDRTFDRQTVAPTTGDTDFELIFQKLSSIGYDGNFILQTARGKDGQEYNTAKKHIKIFKDLHDKHF